jgi:uncharacterized protein (TIGR02265 family)
MGTSQQPLVNGVLLSHMVQFLREKKGDPGVAALEQAGSIVIYDKFTMYPLADYLTLQKNVLDIVFGQENDEGYEMLGKFTFTAFAHSLIGATLIQGSSPKALMEQMQSVWGSLVTFGERKIEKIDEKKGDAIITITDDPRNPCYLQGILESGLEAIGTHDAAITVLSTNENTHTMHVTWKPQDAVSV